MSWSIPLQDGRATVSDNSTDDLLVYIYGNRRKVGLRRDSYAFTVEACRTLFPDIPPDHTISVHTNEMEQCFGEMVEISAEAWTNLMPKLTRVFVLTEATVKEVQPRAQDTNLSLCFILSGGNAVVVQAKSSEILEDVAYRALLIQSVISTRADVSKWGFTYKQRLLDRRWTIARLGFKDNDIIICSSAKILALGRLGLA